MGMEFGRGVLVNRISIKDNMQMTKNVVMVYLPGKLEICIRVTTLTM
jgi:hypothetical protein